MRFFAKTVGIVLLAATIFLCSEESPRAAPVQIIDLKPGQTVDIYFEINLSGNVVIRIATQTGVGCADLWWIKWPLGNVSSLGRHCGTARIPIPGFSSFAIAAKLRATGVTVNTKIIAASTETVANSVRVQW